MSGSRRLPSSGRQMLGQPPGRAMPGEFCDNLIMGVNVHPRRGVESRWTFAAIVGVNGHPRGCVRPRWTFAPPELTPPQRSGSAVGRSDDRNPTTPRSPLHPPRQPTHQYRISPLTSKLGGGSCESRSSYQWHDFCPLIANSLSFW